MTNGEKIIAFTRERNQILHECVSTDEAHSAIEALTDFPKIEKIWLDPKNEQIAKTCVELLKKNLHEYSQPTVPKGFPSIDRTFCPSCLYAFHIGERCGDKCWYAILNGRCNAPDSTYSKLVKAMGGSKINVMSKQFGKEWCKRLLRILE